MGPLFTGPEDILMVRAIAGHSQPHVDAFRSGKQLDSEEAYRLPFMVHGTYLEHVPSIIANGLIAGGPKGSRGSTGRNDVMCAAFPLRDERCRSGMRKDSGNRGPINCQV